MFHIYTYGRKYHKAGSDMAKQFETRINCEHLRNPHSVNALQRMDGRDAKVRAYVMKDPMSKLLIERALVQINQGKKVAFYCFGGRHRSVTLAERVSDMLVEAGHPVTVHHLTLGVETVKEPLK